MSLRALRRWLAAFGLVAVVACSSTVWSFALGSAALPWLLASASGRQAFRRRWHALAFVLSASLAMSCLVAAVSGGSALGFLQERVAPWLSRVYAAAIWLSLLTHDVSGSDLEAVLLRLGLPEGFVALVVATQLFGRQLQATLHAAWAACVLRGGLCSLRALAHTVGAVAGVVVLRSIDRSERIAIAQTLRAGAGLDSAGEP